jgi:hypothetical protein
MHLGKGVGAAATQTREAERGQNKNLDQSHSTKPLASFHSLTFFFRKGFRVSGEREGGTTPPAPCNPNATHTSVHTKALSTLSRLAFSSAPPPAKPLLLFASDRSKEVLNKKIKKVGQNEHKQAPCSPPTSSCCRATSGRTPSASRRGPCTAVERSCDP